MALALYRRYRPDTFDGVIGQDQVTLPLMRALDNNKLTHAYLFSGPRGCGKTSSARILARCVNCAQGPTSHPCGVCDSCKDLATGGPGSIDVVEIDAASHNGVDDARELRERAGFAPVRDRYKIFILDEAHMVTAQGFNALLKIVEEPPEHVMFIFATTEPEKVIGTIRSRTHHYPFRLVPPEIMGPYLEQICEQESIEAAPGVLQLAMRAGGGSMRDTLSVLDQLIIGANHGVIELKSAQALLGFTPEELINNAIEAVIQHDGAALYGVVSDVIIGGYDTRRFVEDLLARIRDLLILALAGEQAEHTLGDTGVDTQQLHNQAQALGLQYLTRMAQDCNDALAHMSGATSPRLRLELLAAKLLIPSVEQNSYHTQTGEAGGDASGAAPAGTEITHTGEHASVQAAANQTDTSAETTGSVSPISAPSVAVSNSQKRAASVSATLTTLGDASSALQQQSAQLQSVQHHVPEHNAQQTSAQPAKAQPAGASQNVQRQETSQETMVSRAQVAVPSSSQQEEHISTENIDERWDALVQGLPADIAQYVNRTKIPRVLLTTTGKPTLWVKFDTALSKYAFALAVSNEEMHGTHAVVDILRAETKRVFGNAVVFSPAKKLGDGSTAVPYSKLSAQEQQRIKAQLLQAQLQSQVLHSLSSDTTAASHQQTSEHHETSTGSEAHHDSAHQAAESNAHADDDADPWAPTNKAQTLHSIEVPHLNTDDPWAQSLAQKSARVTTRATFGAAVRSSAHNNGELHAQESSGVQRAADNLDAAQQTSDIATGEYSGVAGAASTSEPLADTTADQGLRQHTVEPESDEYSLDDDVVQSAAGLDFAALRAAFNVKHEEEFAADDPRNPLVIEAKAHRDAQ